MHKPPKHLFILSVALLVFASIGTSIPFTSAKTDVMGIQTENVETQPSILWNTSAQWNSPGTPAENISDSDVSRLDREWTTPIIVEGFMYVGAISTVFHSDNRDVGIKWVTVFAFNVSNGQQLWRYQANFDTVSSPAILDGRVFFGMNSNYYGSEDTVSCLYALNATNGELLWKTRCSIFSSTPTTYNNQVFINSRHSLLGFNVLTGDIVWNYTIGRDDVFYSPVIATEGVLYAASNDLTLYAFNTTDGSNLWTLKNIKGFSGFIVADKVVYTPSGDGNIYALNAQTGIKLWSYDTTAPEYSWTNIKVVYTPLYVGGVLYFSSYSGQEIDVSTPTNRNAINMNIRFSITALNAVSGHKIWRQTSVTEELGSPAFIADNVVYTANGKSLLGFNSYTGDLVWNYTRSDFWPQTKPVETNGTLYIGYRDEQIYAIELPVLNILAGSPAPQKETFFTDSINYAFFTVISFLVVLGLVLYIKRRRLRVIKTAN